MQKDIHTKMKKLKKRLDFQEEKMMDQKDSVEDLMGNLITNGLKEGSSSECIMDNRSIYQDYDLKGQSYLLPSSDTYIESFLTSACSQVLDNQ
jgi:hypothetical protein